VRIEIAKDGALTAALNFDNPAAAAELRNKSGELRQALSQAAGFNVADNALSFDVLEPEPERRSERPERLLQLQDGGERPSAPSQGKRLPIGPERRTPSFPRRPSCPACVWPPTQRRRRPNLGESRMVTATSSTGNATTDKINNSRNSLATNEQTFLKLLTTQLKNQDPLSPTDTTQMTSQITQMTGVEQQLVTNDLLAALVGMSTGGGISEGVNLMGKQVTAETDKSVLKNKEASWSYTQSRAATGVKIEVTTSSARSSPPILPDDMAAATTPSSGTARARRTASPAARGRRVHHQGHGHGRRRLDHHHDVQGAHRRHRHQGHQRKRRQHGLDRRHQGAAGLGDRRHQPAGPVTADERQHERPTLAAVATR
jgi:hypothetical protein